jgi:hypothetical protein
VKLLSGITFPLVLLQSIAIAPVTLLPYAWRLGTTVKILGLSVDRYDKLSCRRARSVQSRKGPARMTEPSNIRNFEYRPCRIAAGFGIDFVAGGETLHGICRDVSNSGIRATLNGSVAVGNSGVLILHHPMGELKLEAQVAYIEELKVGLEFLFKTTWECAMTIEFVASIANYSPTALVVRYPS